MPQQRGTSGELVDLFAFDLYAVLAEIDLQALRLFLFLVLLVAQLRQRRRSARQAAGTQRFGPCLTPKSSKDLGSSRLCEASLMDFRLICSHAIPLHAVALGVGRRSAETS